MRLKLGRLTISGWLRPGASHFYRFRPGWTLWLGDVRIGWKADPAEGFGGPENRATIGQLTIQLYPGPYCWKIWGGRGPRAGSWTLWLSRLRIGWRWP